MATLLHTRTGISILACPALAALFPIAQHTAHVLKTAEEGAGPILLFLHTLGASGRYWRGELGTLPDRHRCVMPRLLGFGHSPEANLAYDALKHSWRSFSGTLEHCILSHDVTPALTMLSNLPILALHGADDPAAPIANVRALAASMPNLTLVALGDGHHLFLRENAACRAAIAGYLGNIRHVQALSPVYPTGV
jgi:pimeloyl-ACP methyl ester carboxylesterase